MNCIDQASGDGFTLYHGDCVEVVAGLPDRSIDYSIFSPPFASLYTYSNSPRDMGNCRSDAEFFAHFAFLIRELRRVMKPGRNVSFHCMLMPTSKERDGYIGLKDFRGDLIRAFQAEGFIYASEVCIWKDPVTAMQRTKALGLLHKTVRENASMSRQGIPDYLITMRKSGDVEEKVKH
ncbi:MAG: site-specific DNA-methyltransferase, partial [Bradyrhizobium sp.]|nr:site-specific DNA-methyltransferase [Bradyrhizobium sp.]